MRRINLKTMYVYSLNLFFFVLFSFPQFHIHAQELITNGDFETGDLTGWTSSTTGSQMLVVNDGSYASTSSCFDFLNSSNSQSPIDGTYSVLFDMSGLGTNEISTTATLPANPANLIFSFEIEYGREENVSAVEVELLDNSSTLIEKIYTSFDNAAETQLPAQCISLNLTNILASYSGQNISIRISLNMGEACIPAQIDNVSLKNTADYAWKNGQDAFRVIGQANLFTFRTGTGTTMSNTLRVPNDITTDPINNKMYVSDAENNRVLRYNYPPNNNSPAAEAVLGQINFMDLNDDVAADKMCFPNGLHVDDLGNLWVADVSNNRILRFDSAATKMNGANANGVLGQADFDSKLSGTSASSMRSPTDIFIDKNATLWVADKINHRVLRFDNAANKPNGADADGVLGQADFSTNTSGTSANKMNEPTSIFVDNQGTLWVTDRKNHRVLRFDDAANKANGTNADGVLGQSNFTNGSYGLSDTKFYFPFGITGDAQGNIYVSESNNRVMIFMNASNDPSINKATHVLGQSTFGTNLIATTPSSMHTSRFIEPQLYFDPKEELLWVADQFNDRVLGFNPKIISADYFVRIDGSDANDGQSWNTAFATLQKAIESAQAGQTIWVAGGTYYPNKEKDGTTNESRRFSFYFNKDLRIYGGFNGTESDLCERDIVCNPTILSGDIGTQGVSTDNSFHVIESTNLTNDFLLDGFTIQDGYANDDFAIGTRGGAWLNDPLSGTSNPSIYNCIFFNNSGSSGAAMYNDGGSSGETSPIYINCKFIGNILLGSPARGGAIYIDASFSGSSNTRFENCIFSGNGQNNATSEGGAIYVTGGFSGNADIKVVNCSFTNNETTTGGAISTSSFNGTLNMDIQNSILWNNGDEISVSNGTVNLSYSNFDDGSNNNVLILPSGVNDAGNNSDVDPLFTDADGTDDIVGTLDDNLRPWLLSSFVYNSGNDTIINTTRDIAGNLRIIGDGIDKGAYELDLQCEPIFVDADATSGSNDGSYWDNAFLELGDAINAAKSCGTKVIWVAEGTYFPPTAAPDPRDSRFDFQENIEIYGGFNGTEQTLADRDLSAQHETILSGDIGVADVETDNTYTVATVSTSYFMMDGFTITKGRNDKFPPLSGGVFINFPSSINVSVTYNTTFKNCKFEDNKGLNGGAIYVLEDNSYILGTNIINCTFVNNESTRGGGAIYVFGQQGSNILNIVNSSFINNVDRDSLGEGNAIYVLNEIEGGDFPFGTDNISIENSIIWNDGTPIFIEADTLVNIVIKNSILKDGLEDGNLNIPLNVVDGGNNLDADPIFLRAGIGDLRVANCSPALDVGFNPFIGDVSRDLVDSKRIFNSTVDLGAYEWKEEVTSLEVSFLVEADSLVQGVDSIFTSGIVEVVADTIVFEAAEVIILSAGFHAQSGSEFTARIDGCTTENNHQAPADEVTNSEEDQQVEVRHENIRTKAIPETAELQAQAYPNPFTGQTNIQYYLPEAGAVDLFITDLNGNVRYREQMTNVQSAWQQLTLDASDWNSGMYFLFIRTADTQLVKQLIVQQ